MINYETKNSDIKWDHKIISTTKNLGSKEEQAAKSRKGQKMLAELEEYKKKLPNSDSKMPVMFQNRRKKQKEN